MSNSSAWKNFQCDVGPLSSRSRCCTIDPRRAGPREGGVCVCVCVCVCACVRRVCGWR